MDTLVRSSTGCLFNLSSRLETSDDAWHFEIQYDTVTISRAEFIPAPTPPRSSQTGRGPPSASQTAPDSRWLWCSGCETESPAGSDPYLLRGTV